MFKGVNKSSGQILKTLLALGVVILIGVIIAYLVIKKAETPPTPPPDVPVVPLPVYETTIKEIRFVFLEALNKGNILRASEAGQSSWEEDRTTTERFVKVTIGAQNMGKLNTEEKIWDVGNIVDSEGRNYVPLEEEVHSWLPDPDLCGEVLKPSFEPTPCTKIYEVAKVAKDLKIRVIVFDKAYAEIGTEALIDLKLMP